MTKYKVLALDLDGTVLSDRQTIEPQLKQAIRKAGRHCHVVIATGRHHTAARPYHDELDLNTPIICCNGTYLYDYHRETVAKANAIAKQDALDFLALADKFAVKPAVYVKEAMVYAKSKPAAYLQAMEKWAEALPRKRRPTIYAVDSLRDLLAQTDFVLKFVIEGPSRSLASLLENEWVRRHFNGERSWSNRIDFAAKGNSKGKRLCEYVRGLGCHRDHVLAVGDNHNDTSMLRYAGLGVAMGNADDAVKSQADAVCATDNNGNGLARLIQENILGEKS